ncbi:hypothetical protein [Bradyrhizobium sp. CCBAU 11357]|uniref:hypothetical protein n=1 Tax=Bradyrhizobium sp. CCBAU 11357 TaxID=1630808 RepID=UPI00230495E3|nr:hypothetical protein [Bradyrhizobium sp. CCBAU 11357]
MIVNRILGYRAVASVLRQTLLYVGPAKWSPQSATATSVEEALSSSMAATHGR